MEKLQRVPSQTGARHRDDVAGIHETRMRAADGCFALEIPGAKPLIEKREPLAAVIVLEIGNARNVTSRGDGHQFGHSVRNVGQQFGEVYGGVGVVTNTQKEDLSIELECPADWARQNVRR